MTGPAAGFGLRGILGDPSYGGGFLVYGGGEGEGAGRLGKNRGDSRNGSGRREESVAGAEGKIHIIIISISSFCLAETHIASSFFRVVVQFAADRGRTPREIPFGFAQGRLSLRLKNGYGRDDARSSLCGTGFTKIIEDNACIVYSVIVNYITIV